MPRHKGNPVNQLPPASKKRWSELMHEAHAQALHEKADPAIRAHRDRALAHEAERIHKETGGQWGYERTR